MDLGDILDLVNDLLRKNASGRTLKPEAYNRYLQSSNIELYNKLYGKKPISASNMSKEQWEINQVVSDSLSPFKVFLGSPGTMPLKVNTVGVAQIPDDYSHISSMRYLHKISKAGCDTKTKTIPIEILTDNQLGDRLSNPNRQPTKKNPFAVFYDSYIQFYPYDLQFVYFTYLKIPTTPYYAWTLGTDDVPVYDPSNSVQLEWREDDHIEIIRMILDKASVSIDDNEIQQYVNKHTIQGGV